MLQQAAIPVVQEAQGNDHRPVKASIACSGIFLRPVELDDDGTPAAYRDLLRAMQIGAPDWRIRQLIDAMSDDQRRQFIRVGRFETTMGLVVGTDGAGTVLNTQREEINSQIDRMTDQGSGWIFLWMLQGYVNILEHNFLEGGSYIPLPKTIQSRNACINPKNMDDDLCFLYSCVIALHYTEVGYNPERVSKLRPFLARYAYDAKDMPMVAEARRVLKYEKLFQARINIIRLTATEALVPLVCSQSSHNKEINLLVLTNEDNGRSHYVWVRRPSALISSQTRDPSHAHHVCWRCLWMTRSAEAYAQHAADCGPGRACARAVMPSPVGKRKSGETEEAYSERVEAAGRPTMRFRQWEKTLRLPVVIYADGEATTSTRGQGSISERTAVVATQCINSIRMVVVDSTSGSARVLREQAFYGPDCVRRFLDEVTAMSHHVYKQYFEHPKAMRFSDSDRHSYTEADACCFCRRPFRTRVRGDQGNDELIKVRHHCHYTGAYVGAAHKSCNRAARVSHIVPVIHHNFKGYDQHALINILDRSDYDSIKIVPDNAEKWKGFALQKIDHAGLETVDPDLLKHRALDEVSGLVRLPDGCEVRNRGLFYRVVRNINACRRNRRRRYQIRFLDSLLFVQASLDSVAKSMAPEDFTCIKGLALELGFRGQGKLTVEEAFSLLRRKGVYPYEWFDDEAKWNACALPPIQAFVSLLQHGTSDYHQLTPKDRSTLEEDYAFAGQVWQRFGLQTFREYHDLYLRLDVLLLADVFERFRNVFMTGFGIDPCHYYTLPGAGWEAALKKTGSVLELFGPGEEDKYIFCEEAKRGGVSMVGALRYAEANNPYLADYDESRPSSYLMYVDANSLYMHCEKMKLPYKGFEWLKCPEAFDVMGTDGDGDTGYFVEVDVMAPPVIHDEQSDYPAFPENVSIAYSQLSPLQQQTAPIQPSERAPDPVGERKLIPNLMPKVRYKVHLQTLQYWLSKGWVLTKVHRVMRFQQKAWLKPFVDYCIEQRQKATTDFERDFWKLLGNSVFGKTMEDVRSYTQVSLVHATEEEARFKRLCARVGVRGGRAPIKISDNMYAIEVPKETVRLCKPIYAGMAILDLSKLYMHEFWYDVLKARYAERLRLVYTDTDAFIYHVQTQDHYKDLMSMRDLFDFSGYDQGHFLYDPSNKKVTGKFKDETHGVPIKSVAAVRSKMYSLEIGDERVQKNTGKGIWKKALASIRHSDYVRTIFHEHQAENMSQQITTYKLRAVKHVLRVERQVKTSISSHDDKRYLLDDGVSQLPHGHWRTDRVGRPTTGL